MPTPPAPTDPTTTPPVPTAPPPRRRRRFWRWLTGAFVLFLLLVVIAPHAVALTSVRERIAEELTREFGAPVHIGRLGFSWFTGLAVRDVEIGNPPGFAAERPALRLQRAALEVPLLALLRGEVAIAGSLTGLEVLVDQHAAGDTNLQALLRPVSHGRSDAPRDDMPSPGPGTRSGDALRSLRCELTLRGSRLELHRDGRRLDAIHVPTCRVHKPHGSDQLLAELAAELPALGASPPTAPTPVAATAPAGRVSAELRAGLIDHDIAATLRLDGIDLQRLAAFVDAVAPGQLTVLAGVARGELRATTSGESTTIDGELIVDAPRIAGPLLAGLDLRAHRWTLVPTLRRDGDRDDASRCRFDLGCLQLQGSDAPAAGAARFAWTLDVDALASAGELLPAWLRGSGARATGTLTVGSKALQGDLDALRETTHVDGVVTVPHATIAGFALRDFAADTVLTAERFALTGRESTRLDQGPLRLELQSDLRAPALPTTLAVRWQQGQLQGGAATGLRWVVPMFAGLDAGATVRGRCDFEASLAGPGRREAGENWLQWLDRWTGLGRIAVRDGAVVPSAGLAGLLAPLGPLAGASARLGDGPQLAIDAFEAPFRFAKGAITTTAGNWLAKGRTIGVLGTVRLDGKLDIGFDLTALLRGHRDGDRVLQALGGSLPPARLGGTVEAPMLGLPDFAAALQRLAERELQQRGTDLLRKELEDLLRKSKKR